MPHAEFDSLSRAPDQVFPWYGKVLEGQLSGRGGMGAHFVQVPVAYAGPVQFHEERGHAVMLLGLVGVCENYAYVRDRGIGNPALGSVQDVTIAVAHRRGPP